MFPLGCCWARASLALMSGRPVAARAALPTVIPNWLKNSRRLTSCAIFLSSFGGETTRDVFVGNDWLYFIKIGSSHRYVKGKKMCNSVSQFSQFPTLNFLEERFVRQLKPWL